MNSFNSKAVLRAGGRQYEIYRLESLDKAGLRTHRLPYSLRVLLENLLRHENGKSVTAEDIKNLANWDPKAAPSKEIAFMPARVLMQDFTGVPAIVDLAAMRDAMQKLGGDPEVINPLLPAELVIDHSVQVDEFGSKSAFSVNAALEFLSRVTAHRAITVILSDFLGENTSSRFPLARLPRSRPGLVPTLVQASFAALRQANRRHTCGGNANNSQSLEREMVQNGQQVGVVLVEAVGTRLRWPIGASIPPQIHRHHLKVSREVRHSGFKKLHVGNLVEWSKDHGGATLAPHCEIRAHTFALDESVPDRHDGLIGRGSNIGQQTR